MAACGFVRKDGTVKHPGRRRQFFTEIQKLDGYEESVKNLQTAGARQPAA
jgi:hypothetical protein